jgi:transcription antitermination factor NusG
VIDILKNSKGPLPIPTEQIENVIRLEKYEGEIISFSEFACGMAVRVIQGPLQGVKGFVDEIQRDLVKISVESIPGSVAIHVSPTQIEPIETDCLLSSMLH